MTDPESGKHHAQAVLDPASLIRAYQKKFQIDVRRFFFGRLEYRQDPRTHLFYFHPAAVGDELFYDQLSRARRWYYQETKIEYQTVSEYTRGRKVLDVGCGEGRFAATAEAKQFVGLELNAAAARRGRERGLDIREEPLERFSESNRGAFDVVCLFQVAEHVADPIRFLRLAKRCLSGEGKLIVSVPAHDSFVGKATNNLLNLPPHHLTRWPDSCFGELAELLNLNLERLVNEPLEKVHVHWYASVFTKHKIEKILGIRPGLFDFSRRSRAVSWATSLLGMLLAPAVYLLSGKIRGHTVTAVFSRREEEMTP